MPVIGVVGGIGSGKSFISAALAELGARVIDADQIGHDVLRDPETIASLIASFGPSILEQPKPESGEVGRGTIDRKVLGQLVFSDPNARRKLESLVHPAMRRSFAECINQARRDGSPAVVLDAAVLFEAGWDDLCDWILFVDCPQDVRRLRVQSSRGWSQQHLEQREAAQWPLTQKRERADSVVRNASDDPQSRTILRDELQQLWRLWTEGSTQPRSSRARAHGHADAGRSSREQPPAAIPQTNRVEPTDPSSFSIGGSIRSRGEPAAAATTPP